MNRLATTANFAPDAARKAHTLDDLRAVLDRTVVELRLDDLPDLIGMLAAADARARVRLMVLTPTSAVVEVGELVTAEVVAKRFNLALSTVHELARLGRVPCRQFGRYRRFDLGELAAAGLNDKTASLAPHPRGKKVA